MVSAMETAAVGSIRAIDRRLSSVNRSPTWTPIARYPRPSTHVGTTASVNPGTACSAAAVTTGPRMAGDGRCATRPSSSPEPTARAQ